MVEVLHYIAESVVKLSDHMIGGDTHILKRNVRSAAAPPPHRFLTHNGDARQLGIDQQQRHPLHALSIGICADSRREISCLRARGNELLFAIHNEVITVAHCGASDSSNVAASPRLRHGERKRRLSCDGVPGHLVLQHLRAVVQHWRQSNVGRKKERRQRAARRAAADLRQQDKVHEHVPALWGRATVFLRPRRSEDTCGVRTLRKVIGTRAGLVPFVPKGFDVLFDERTNFELEASVLVVVVGAAEGASGVHPVRLRERQPALLDLYTDEGLGLAGRHVDTADAQPTVHVLLQDGVVVHQLEVLSGVLSRVAEQHLRTAGVELGELRHVVDETVDDDPRVVSARVLGNFVTIERFQRADLCIKFTKNLGCESLHFENSF
eukprot:PhM_4_TR11326/c1_g1_i1/m.51688